MSLLTPHDRTLLIESLRPPAGYQVDIALGTTFSLDLVAMMVAPVGFTLFELESSDSAVTLSDPMEIIEAIRRHASQIVLFCQAGRIAVPTRYRPLLAYLEERIIAAKAPAPRHSFHPKVWVIRYINESKDIAYRLLCLSRNLTFDRSWDTVLTLDGPLRADRTKGFGNNAGLSEFVSTLPSLALSKITPGVRSQVRTIENEIGRVDWDLGGTPFEELKFWPLGHDGRKTWPFTGRLERMAVVSPFVTPAALQKLAGTGGNSVLVSRKECLDPISTEIVSKFGQSYVLSPQGAILEPDAEVDVTDAPVGEATLQGLHAKLYIADDGWNGRIWTGSANATDAAFGGNVEFLVELLGKKSNVGVDAFMEKIKGTASFSDLLEPYVPTEIGEVNAALEELKHKLDDLRLSITEAQWSVTVTADETGQEFLPVASTKSRLPAWPDNVKVTCRPLSVGEENAAPLAAGVHARVEFKTIALETLTSFLVLRVSGEVGGAKHALEFIVNAALIGAPANRKDRLLRHMIQDRAALIRFLMLLLSDIADVPTAHGGGREGSWRYSGVGAADGDALFEPLLRALSRSPARLKTVKSLLDELANSEDGSGLVPDGLPALFDVIWAASEVGAT